jgi:hypothetical protein
VTAAHDRDRADLSLSDLDARASHEGSLALVHHAARAMREQRSGSITSAHARSRLAGSSYAAAMARWRAPILLGDGARPVACVNCINPAQIAAGPPARHEAVLGLDPHTRRTEPCPRPRRRHRWCSTCSATTAAGHGQVIFLSAIRPRCCATRAERFAFRPEGWTLADLKLYFRETVGAQSRPGHGEPRYLVRRRPESITQLLSCCARRNAQDLGEESWGS